jgi:FHIPEP family
MTEPRSSAGAGQQPAISVHASVGGPLSVALATAPAALQATRTAIGAAVQALVTDLGLVGTVVVSVDTRGNHSTPPVGWVRLQVNGDPCRYSAELARQVITVAERGEFERDLDLTVISGEGALDASTAVEAVALLCGEAVKLRPSVLIAHAHARAYVTELAAHAGEEWAARVDPAQLLSAICHVVDQRISLARRDVVAKVLLANVSAKPEDLGERLISALASDCIEVLVPPEYKQWLGTGNLADEADQLAFAASGIFEELGITFPPLRYGSAESLPRGTWAFRINDLLTLPRPVLPVGWCLVNDTPERVAMVIDQQSTASVSDATEAASDGDDDIHAPPSQAQPIVNPATDQPATALPAVHRQALQAAGLTTWDEAGYVILCLANTMRAYASCFVSSARIDAQVDTLPLPALVSAVRERWAAERVAGVVRTLLADCLEIRDLELVLERLLDVEYAGLGADRVAVLDDPVAALHSSDDTELATEDPQVVAGFVRRGLRRRTAWTFTRGTGTLVVYLLEGAVEAGMESLQGEPSHEQDEALITVVADELRRLPPSVQLPLILTTDAARRAIQAALRPVFPRIVVLGHGDLPGDVNVQPVARIGSASAPAPS